MERVEMVERLGCALVMAGILRDFGVIDDESASATVQATLDAIGRAVTASPDEAPSPMPPEGGP